MKLTDNLEKQAESAAVKEEKGETIGKAVLQLNDHELEAVSGGRTYQFHQMRVRRGFAQRSMPRISCFC